MGNAGAFEGAKMALFLGADLAVILRDDVAGLPFADHWDLPGGGREGQETPWACAQRECQEELGLHVPDRARRWGRAFAEGAQTKWFFAAHLPAQSVQDVVFGNEGQRWTLMRPQTFLSHPKAVPAFQDRLRIYMADVGLM